MLFNIDFSSVYMAFVAGLTSSVNPCALTTILIYFSILLMISHDRLKRNSIGLGILFGILGGCLLLNLGFLDQVVSVKKASYVYRTVYLVLGMLVIVLAGVNLYDWWKLIKSPDPKNCLIQVPFLAHKKTSDVVEPSAILDNPWPKRLKFFLFFILGIFLGFIFALLAWAWPPSYYLSTIFYSLFLPDFKLTGYIAFVAYALAYTALAIFLFIVMVKVSGKKELISKINQHLGRFKIVFAAVCGGVATGLFYIFL